MKKLMITLGGILLLSLLALSPIQLNSAKGNSTATGNSSTAVMSTPLTASEIAAAWPNLPSAKALYDAGHYIMVDLRYAGKQVPHVNGFPEGDPDPNYPTVYNASSLIANCTSDDTLINLGITVHNDPHIWLEYNSSVYVEVPASYLQTSVQPYATAVQQILNAHALSAGAPSPQQQPPPNWALGLYDNPHDASGSYPVTGAISYGEWTRDNFPATIGVDVLSVQTSTHYGLQNVMQLKSQGMSLAIQIFDPNGNSPGPITYTPWSTTPSKNTLYNLIIVHWGSCWWWMWNWTYFYGFADTFDSRIVVGNQPNVVVETNDWTQGDLNRFSTNFGGETYSNGAWQCLPAIGFQFNNHWSPTNTGDSYPAAYEYNDNPFYPPSGIFGVGGNSGTPGWGSSYMGIGLQPSNNAPEQFRVFYTSSSGYQPSQGHMLWNRGGWSPPYP